MDKSIINILDELDKRIERTKISDTKKKKYADELNHLKKEYDNLDIQDAAGETYDSIVKKGRELIKVVNEKETKKVDYYLRYCHAALYDFRDNLKPLNWIIRSYLISCMLFIALAPQYFGFILPIVFLLPIYLGLKGMKKRSYSGFLFGGSVMPMAFLTSLTIIRNMILASKDFNGYINSLALEVNRSPEYVRNLTIIMTVLGMVLLINTVYAVIIGVKHRKMFV